ncbi:hypothetical protein C942_02756 [Photobacterium marinum]|uniref:Uncharacterized protein n=1 Tax=Photobacterium marinum TaxID=1056511 RepID=L8JIJ8_9GAMM|nr:hypothetical protein [Photobacterium marinum]ELR67247.1 hypothetical protein C942_02756 [Photobacterium marinum]
MMNWQHKVDELRNIGIKFNEENVRDSLKKAEQKGLIQKTIVLAKELDLDLQKDITKTSIAIVVSNYNSIEDCHKKALMNVYHKQCKLISDTIKQNDIFLEILYILGEAVDRRAS